MLRQPRPAWSLTTFYAAHELYDTVNARLRRDLLSVKDEHSLHIGQLADNAAELSEGWGVLRDSRNEFLADDERWMWRKLFAEEQIERRFIHGSLDEVQGRDDIRWKEKKVEDNFRSVHRSNEEMAVLVPLTAGSPASGLVSKPRTDQKDEVRGRCSLRTGWQSLSRRTTREESEQEIQDRPSTHPARDRRVGGVQYVIVGPVDPAVAERGPSADRVQSVRVGAQARGGLGRS